MESSCTLEGKTSCPRMSSNTWRKCRKVTSFHSHWICLKQSPLDSKIRLATNSRNSWTNQSAEGGGRSLFWPKRSKNSKSKLKLDLQLIILSIQVLAGLSGRKSSRPYTLRTKLQTRSKIWMLLKKNRVTWSLLPRQLRASWLERNSIRRQKRWRRFSRWCSTWVLLPTFKLKFPKTPLVKRTSMTPWDRKSKLFLQQSLTILAESLV